MKTKFTFLALLITVLGFASSAFAGGKGWVNDLDEALSKGKTEGKLIMAEFTGSDWCPPCIQMNKAVFSKEEFVTAASPNYVLAYVDTPRGDKTVAEANSKYFSKYKIEGVPTVIIFNSDGTEKERFTATAYSTMETFVAKLNKTAGK